MLFKKRVIGYSVKEVDDRISDYENLIDTKRSLSWVRYDKEESAVFARFNRQMRAWSSQEAVRKYVSGEFDLDRYLLSLAIDEGSDIDGLFYCFTDNELCGVALVSAPEGNSDETSVQYIVVNPNMQGKGLGTAMLSSIFTNGNFFTRNMHKGKFVTSVHKDNVASQKACLKSGFILAPAKNNDRYLKLVFKDKSKSMGDD